MKVAMYYKNADVRLEEMPVPKIGPEEILIRVYASGICGSDLMEWYRLPKAPLVLGHEIAGQIVEIGEKVSNFKVGEDRPVLTRAVFQNLFAFLKLMLTVACLNSQMKLHMKRRPL